MSSKLEPADTELPFDSDDSEHTSFLLSSFQTGLNLVRPWAPQLVPLVVCLVFIPLILALSTIAGYVVWSNLSAQWETPLYMQYGDGVTPYAQISIHNLHSQQRYDVSLHLKVPATESNFQLGNFMTTLTLTTMNNATLATVRRPAIAIEPNPSGWWAWFFGKPNVINIDVPLLSAFVPGNSRIQGHVQVGRFDQWKSIGSGQGRELSILSASLRGLAVPHGIRGLAIRFRLLSSLVAGFTFLTILTVIMGTCVLPAVLPSQDALTEGEGKPKRRVGSNSIAFPSYDNLKVRKKRKSHARRSTSEGTGLGLKQEESFSMIPPAEDPIPERIRQRRISTKRESQEEDS
ncbi:hypothetical protein CC1G_01735 [Coprinopsis cinerea okayama7|uniref:Adipose-regulatory protein n=1 Tax=Coprinopsis cinerea (strain Okayama-7 / 130 / ATCC MYA-4618 / FGSC 9003) TaxID=240176 RepID=A8N2L8_COPC7|nr:hypothetical protein CC1G_01735 [Coprinopsis cinerea okayama7\|eukprot:XP_001829055.1 hypothetical protein CC1G_01735 [Coprinopsis cinerea okayama7\